MASSLSLALVLTAVGCGGRAAVTEAERGEQPLPKPERQLHFRTPLYGFKLPNGIRVVVVPDWGTDLVEVAARYQVGSIDDPPGKEGMAHLVEHVLFHPRLGGPGQPSIAERLRERALDSNAYTALESTHYMAVAPADRLEELLEIEAHRLLVGCTAVDREAFEREQEIVRNEVRQQREGLGFLLPILLQGLYSPSHPYSHPTSGDDHSVARISFEEACAFARTHYVPERLTVVLSGRVDRIDLGRMLARTLERVPARVSPPRPQVPEPVAKRRIDARARVDTPWVVVAWPAPPRFGQQGPLSDITFELFADAVEDALERDGLVDNAGHDTFGAQRAPWKILWLVLADGVSADAALERVWKVADGISTRATRDRVFRYRIKAVRVLFDALEPVAWRGALIADYLQFDDTRELVDGAIFRIDAVRPEQVRAHAARLLARDAATVMVVEPDPEAPAAYDRNGLAYEGAGHDGERWQPPASIEEARRPLPLELPRSRLSSARRFSLPNGMRVVLLPSSWVPTVELRLLFEAGFRDEPAGGDGMAAAAVELLRPPAQPVERVPADYGRRALADAGGSLFTEVTDEHTAFRVYGLKSYSDYLVHSLALLVRDGHYVAAEVGRFRERQRRLAAHALRARNRSVWQRFYAGLWGAGHPYARMGSATPESAVAIDVAALNRFRRAHLVPSRATLVVLGSFDAAVVEAHVRAAFGDWSSGPGATRASLPAPAARERPLHVAVEDSDALTVRIDIAYATPSGLDERYPARIVAARMIHDAVEAVRERTGASYGVGADYDLVGGSGRFMVQGTVDPERAAEAFETITAALAPPTGDDFDLAFVRARRAVAREIAGALLGRSSLPYMLEFIEQHRLELDHYDRLLVALANLTPGDVRAIFDEELDPRHQVFFATGRLPAVLAGFTAIGSTPEQWPE